MEGDILWQWRAFEGRGEQGKEGYEKGCLWQIMAEEGNGGQEMAEGWGM